MSHTKSALDPLFLEEKEVLISVFERDLQQLDENRFELKIIVDVPASGVNIIPVDDLNDTYEQSVSSLVSSLSMSTDIPSTAASTSASTFSIPSKPAINREISADEFLSNSIKNASSSTGANQDIMNVKFLPELLLNLFIPNDYPSNSPPVFEIQVLPGLPSWISPSYMTKVRASLNELWESQKGSAIIYTWYEFIKFEMLTKIFASSDNNNSQLSIQVKRNQLTAYQENEARSWIKQFNDENHTCTICFSDKNGREFTVLHPCKHSFCNICTTANLEVQINEGRVTTLRCMFEKCTSSFHPKQVQKLLSPEKYYKYESLLLERGLEQMGDLCFCPKCQTPCVTEKEDGFTQCTKCEFIFCSKCYMMFHPGSPCYADGAVSGTAGIASFAAGKEQMQKVLAERKRIDEERKNIAFIRESMIPCPRCKMPVEKEDGCNKMTCRCGCYFCYLCGADISTVGYDHFRNEGKCGGRLFEIPQELVHEQVWDRFENAREPPPVPEGPHEKKKCPGCGRDCYRDPQTNLNRIKCWRCDLIWCFLCFAEITKGKNHFGLGGCPQHGNKKKPAQANAQGTAATAAKSSARIARKGNANAGQDNL